MLDGNGHIVVSHNHTSYGRLSLSRVSNVTVKNFVIPYEGRYNEQIIGISLNDTTRVKVANNTITGFWSIQALNGILFAGIYVVGGSSNTFTHNSLLYNLDGIEFVNTSHNLIVENSITSNIEWIIIAFRLSGHRLGAGVSTSCGSRCGGRAERSRRDALRERSPGRPPARASHPACKIEQKHRLHGNERA